MNSGSRAITSALQSSALRIGVPVSPYPLKTPSTRLWANRTGIPAMEIR